MGYTPQTVLAPNGRIIGPADVIEAECFGPGSWQPSISSDGVKIEIARLRQRALAA
jgi:hypothetical protein